MSTSSAHQQARVRPRVVVDGPNVGRFLKQKGSSASSSRMPVIETELIANAYNAVQERFPEAVVEILVYQPDLARWDRENDPHIARIRQQVTEVPSRSDVDDLVLQRALKCWRQGQKVRILSNDNYDVYREDSKSSGKADQPKAIAGVTREWLQAVLWKFSFSTVDRDCLLTPVDDLACRSSESESMMDHGHEVVAGGGSSTRADVFITGGAASTSTAISSNQQLFVPHDHGGGATSSTSTLFQPNYNFHHANRTSSASADDDVAMGMEVDEEEGVEVDHCRSRTGAATAAVTGAGYPGQQTQEYTQLGENQAAPDWTQTWNQTHHPDSMHSVAGGVEDEGVEIELPNGFAELREKRRAMGVFEEIPSNGTCFNLGQTELTQSLFQPHTPRPGSSTAGKGWAGSPPLAARRPSGQEISVHQHLITPGVPPVKNGGAVAPPPNKQPASSSSSSSSARKTTTADTIPFPRTKPATSRRPSSSGVSTAHPSAAVPKVSRNQGPPPVSAPVAKRRPSLTNIAGRPSAIAASRSSASSGAQTRGPAAASAVSKSVIKPDSTKKDHRAKAAGKKKIIGGEFTIDEGDDPPDRVSSSSKAAAKRAAASAAVEKWSLENWKQAKAQAKKR
ncbi:unnamed protein product [Amoebophrya sp. A120]|nr:unnamed protein product [Amoebophrya sp. A120]|eukprot:GSA120T00011786001.1